MYWVTCLFIYPLTCRITNCCFYDYFIHSFTHSDGTSSGHQVVSTVKYIMQKDNADCLTKIHQLFGPIKSSE